MRTVIQVGSHGFPDDEAQQIPRDGVEKQYYHASVLVVPCPIFEKHCSRRPGQDAWPAMFQVGSQNGDLGGCDPNAKTEDSHKGMKDQETGSRFMDDLEVA